MNRAKLLSTARKSLAPDYGDMLKRGIGYTPENRKEAGIIPRLGVDENTVLTNRQKISANGVLYRSTIRRLTEEVMQRMTVKAASSETPIGTLSGGNQQKSGDRSLGLCCQPDFVARRANARRRYRSQTADLPYCPRAGCRRKKRGVYLQ